MASRWRAWDVEFRDNIPSISQQVYQEPIRIEQPQSYSCHFLPNSLIELIVSEANKRCVLECEDSLGYEDGFDRDVKPPDTDSLNHSDNYSDTMSCTSLIGEISQTSLTNSKRPISSSCPNLTLPDSSSSTHLMKGVKNEKIENGKGRATLLKQRAMKALALNQQTMTKMKPIGRGRAKFRSLK